MDLNKLILIFFLTIFGFLFYKYFGQITKKYNPNLLIDNEFKKPQAFHNTAISISGGIGIYLSLTIFYFYFLLFYNFDYSFYLLFCTPVFLLGLIDDIKISVSPKVRLFLMTAFLIFLVKYNNFYIYNSGINLLNNWLLGSEIFSLIFICLCFLFIINGANLIDGFNGLLCIHSLIILLNLLFINFFNNNIYLANIILFVVLILFIFLKFNFPKAKVFLGDGGSYLLGSLIALLTIKTSIDNPEISPFYFCLLLFYLFFEVFFSFFRKLLIEKTSPIRPDKKHLHMLLYEILVGKNISKLKSNFYTSIVINMVYLVLIIPPIFMMDNGMFCKYYSLIFFASYIYLYRLAYNKVR